MALSLCSAPERLAQSLLPKSLQREGGPLGLPWASTDAPTVQEVPSGSCSQIFAAFLP